MRVGVRVFGVSAVPLSPLRPLLARLTDLKRVRTPDGNRESLSTRAFRRAWAALARGDDPARVARRETAAALVAVELAGVDAAVLSQAGLSDDQTLGVFRKALAVAAAPVGADLHGRLAAVLPDLLAPPAAPCPAAFVDRLVHQPRAGATHPTKPRLILEPAESHADHCLTVAVFAVVLGPWAGDTEHGAAFLAGLSHHLHNAVLPDAGFAGEELLGEHLAPIMHKLTAAALAELPTAVADEVRAARELLPAPDSPAAKCFHAADVLDRVLEMVHYDRVAQFRVAYALADLELVHPGPLQVFQNEVLLAAGVPS